MPLTDLDALIEEWNAKLDAFPLELHQFVEQCAQAHKETLATYFYQQMLADRDAATFLSHEQVKTRLHGSMQRWIVGLFQGPETVNVQEVIQQQVHVGDVHARISIPVHLVLRGARALKARFVHLLHDTPAASPELIALASRRICDTIDLAMEIMSHAYASSHDRKSRAEEAYRMFAVAQNISSEKERQRAALLDWENQLMFDKAIGLQPEQLPRVGSSEFGLWFRHKGAHAFEGSHEARLILDSMERIDNVLLPAFGRPLSEVSGTYVDQLRELREQSKSMVYHLDRLFEQNTVIESGRDVLTQLLNRKFLPVVLNKQVSYAREKNQGFAILAFDIDHFKSINDNYGHDAGDQVLQQFSSLLINNSRGGDFLFRMGGEEFMMLLADVLPGDALRTAEKLRERVASEPFRLDDNLQINITCSVGLAMFNGHPDYQQMLQRADAALYQAKSAGRNCTVSADH
ncbi:diguanylate cyclase [Marinobacterium litorale]|uniref:diguanylate cyclase n=1 Tax=Marinobacterium litorale TaxID=404770 RepID=UPI0004276B74|nr:diguanylate cyclase [Marinobacterium litorale]